MNYPYKYCLIVDFDEPYTYGCLHFYFCDYNEAHEAYKIYDSEGRKCILYRMLQSDNFDL